MKYLSNGRKVLVIQKLNDKETIVQEIFTKSGKEFPSGEKFAVKTYELSDSPVLSYAQKEEIEARASIEKTEQKQKEADNLLTNTYEKIKGVEAVLRSSENLTKSISADKLKILTAFMTGTIEYLVIDGYGPIQPPIRLINGVVQFERSYYGEIQRFDSIKLISVLGKSDGDLHYRIHQYSDGSGGSGYEVYPFLNKRDALSHIKEKAIKQIIDNRLSEESYQSCVNMGIVFNKEIKAIYFKNQENDLLKAIDVKKEEIETRNNELRLMNTSLKILRENQ